MKGIVLAGGLGTRLRPLTRVTNKHLLPVYDRPMIFYPLEMLVEADIHDILVVTGGNNAGDFLRLLGNGKDFGLRHLNLAYQEGEGGIAAALSLAEFFADGDLLCVVLGDNLVEKSIRGYVEKFKKAGSRGENPSGGSSRSSAFRSSQAERKPHPPDRREADCASLKIRRHWYLYVRSTCLRYHPKLGALRSQ